MSMLCVRAILCRRLATTSAPFVGVLRRSNKYEPLQQALGRAEVVSLVRRSWPNHGDTRGFHTTYRL